jgi:hypothetical protein
LKKFEQERAAAFNLQQSQQDHEIRRMETINRLSDLAIAAVAAPSNVEAVAQIMNADSGRHVAGADPGAGAGGGGGTRCRRWKQSWRMTPAEEREQRDAE